MRPELEEVLVWLCSPLTVLCGLVLTNPQYDRVWPAVDWEPIQGRDTGRWTKFKDADLCENLDWEDYNPRGGLSGGVQMFCHRDFESTLHLVLRLRGGAKKRKKKSYTTPKKNKHKRKKVKLAVLKYYKVDENGKIHRLRRECPADECGAGVFMASHFDRHYCGKCCLTYCFNKPEDK
ncbi:RS27A protein, partial [Polypterus senegalus]